jgi:hypothetical protein
MCTEYAVKNILRVLSIRYKNLLFYEFLNIQKEPKLLKIFKKHIVGIHMGSKATVLHPQLQTTFSC